ncbi:MAG: DegV family EDD domain-containing protein [Bacteroidales bacterium]|nr:DegV family EDD domain-containing protein [Lachnoclostridium sp.]MCM1383621.1 DegV family EDD domain-containing protein [Lachnoclostridium sp.]MCM1465703.1 DegV family EDD domain-containing protein [Bacteroidales bacterium]
MKRLYGKIREMLYRRDYSLNERIFRMIILIGSGMAAMGIIECLILMDVMTVLIPLIILLIVMVAELLITFKYRKIEVAAVIVALLIILVVFPAMFFFSGGLNGGATIWFTLGLFYVFLMFSGKKLAFFLTLAVTVNVVTYLVGYCHPEMIIPMESQEAAYMDSLFAMLTVGLAGGAIVKLQTKIFNIENSVVKKQQEELEKINDSQNTFFASMSHEIRTPINTIIGLNEVILRESGEAQTKVYARNIQNAGRMLLSLVNDILDLSQMEMKKMEIVPLEYQTVKLFRDLIDMIQTRMKEKKLEFVVDIDESLPSVLRGDVKRVTQVLLNILTNAVKYTDRGCVTLSVRGELLKEDEISLQMSVADTGIGIQKEDLQHLYDSFRRLDAKKNLKVEGSGLGLSITKQLLDMMDGEITVDSIYTKGSVFTVTLPQTILDPTPIGNVKFLSGDREALEEYRQKFEAPEARILIVDDNPMNCMVVKKLLEHTKVQVDTAKSGAECLEMTASKFYHVILMDYLMPEMDGVQTLKLLRKQENGLCRDSAVTVLSANSFTEAGRFFKEDGFDAYLEKPIQGDALEEAILKLLPEDIVEYRLSVEAEKEEETPRQIHHKKRKIYITTDCVSDLPEKLMEKYDIGLMYLYIRTDSGRFADTLEISADSLNQYMTDTVSSAFSDGVSVEEYEGFFAEALTQAEHIIHISMASGMGQSYETARTAAQCFDHVTVLDAAQMSCGQALVVLYAGKLAMEGYLAHDICQKVEKMKNHVRAWYIMPTAKIFGNRGYMGKTSAKMCEILKLHPIATMRRSRMVVKTAEGGRLEGAWKRFIRWHLRHKRKINTDIIFISHAGCSVEQQELIRKEVLRCIPFERVIMQRTSVSIACNSGIGTFGFAYYENAVDRELAEP